MSPEDADPYQQVWEDIKANGSCFESSPVICDYLHTDGDFGHELHLYTDRHPKHLKHLVVQSVCLESQQQTGLPNLQQLTQLTKLEVHENKEENGILRGRGPCNIPTSLRHLAIYGHDVPYCGSPKHTVHHMKQLVPHLKLLTHLEISDSCMTFVKSSITYLSGLNNLHLHGGIRADWFNLTALTNLTALDLSHTSCHDIDSAMQYHYGGAMEAKTDPLQTFTAWSNLRILNVISCSLFAEDTTLNIPLVEEVLVDWVPAGTTSKQFVCHIGTYDFDLLRELSVDAYAVDHLVNFKVDFEDLSCSGSQVSSGVQHFCSLVNPCKPCLSQGS